MASTNHTSNYNLPQWEATDPFKREDFNDAFQKIDTAVKAAEGAGIKMELGNYTGSGNYGESNKSTLEFSFAPRVVLLSAMTDAYARSFFFAEQTSAAVINMMKNNVLITLNWSTDGKTVTWYSNNTDSQLNISGTKYYYIALG